MLVYILIDVKIEKGMRTVRLKGIANLGPGPVWPVRYPSTLCQALHCTGSTYTAQPLPMNNNNIEAQTVV